VSSPASIAPVRRRPGLIRLVAFVAAVSTTLAAISPVAAAEPGDDHGLPTPRPDAAYTSLVGVDVSHHQDWINWGRVRAEGVRFAFMKVTEGERYIDPLYAYNHRSARYAGIRTGAYHYAQPSTRPGSAIRQAEHFLAWFDLRDGDLTPVLDLERTNGLEPADLVAWTLAWLDRVRARTGLSGIVYVSPNFWQTRLEDTTAIADAGYTLWVAHWDVETPRMPADDWATRGWTLWQYEDCGRVDGIEGCAQLDHIAGSLEGLVYRGPGFPLTGDHFAPRVHDPIPGPYPDEGSRGPGAPIERQREH